MSAPLITCGCGKSYTYKQLGQIEYRGPQRGFPGGTLLLFNCPEPCGSTMSVPVETYNDAMSREAQLQAVADAADMHRYIGVGR